MSERISIKVIVAGRTYPLTLAKGEEDKVLKAAEDINRSIKMLQDNYAVKDMQDLLAMTALQLASKSSKDVPTQQTSNAQSDGRLEEMTQQLENLLEEIEKDSF